MFNEFDASTTYGKVHVYSKGSGAKVVLLLHGAGSDNAMLSWREVMNSIDGSEYTVYAPDLMGHGGSDYYVDIAGDNFYDIHIDSIKQLVDALHLERFTLAGLSMGGAIAIGFALRYPQIVTSLIPVSSWGLSKRMPMHSFSYWYINKTDMTMAQYRWCAKSKALAKWTIGYSLIGNKKLITDELVGEVMESCKGDRAGISMLNFQRSSATKTGTKPYYIDRLRELAMPVIYVAGELDPLVPKADLEIAAKLTPNGKLELIEGCKHWSVKEAPERFCKLLSDKH